MDYRNLRNRDVPINPMATDEPGRESGGNRQPAGETADTEGRRRGGHRSPSIRAASERSGGHRSSAGVARSRASSRRSADLELLALQERLALEEQRVAARRVEEEQRDAARRAEEDQRRAEAAAEDQRRLQAIREQLIRREFEVRRASISGSSRASSSVRSVRVESPDHRVADWIQRQRSQVPPAAEPPVDYDQRPPAPVLPPVAADLPRISQIHPPSVPLIGSQPVHNASPPDVPVTQLGQVQSPDKGLETYLIRKAAGRELPTFSGDPNDWLLFITAFRRSTEVCRFSEEENLVRLQKALTGRAKESVGAMLCLPGTIPDIIKTLELQYGRPQIIIRNLINKFKKVPKLVDDQGNSIIELYNKVNNLVVSIEALGCPEYLLNLQLIDELVDKLTPNLRLLWGEELATKPQLGPSIKAFRDWLYKRALAMSLTNPDSSHGGRDGGKKQHLNVVDSKVGGETNRRPCSYCQLDGHILEKCRKFSELSVDERLKWVREAGICFGCLKSKHRIADCTSRKRCGVGECRMKHHALLHTNRDKDRDKDRKGVDTLGSAREPSAEVLLKILPVRLRGPQGEVVIRALLDDGATATLIDRGIALKLGLRGPVAPLTVQWITGVASEDHESERVCLTISGVSRGCKRFSIDGARTIENLALPNQVVDEGKVISNFPKLRSFRGLFDNFDPPKMVIGQDHWMFLESMGRIRNELNGLALEKTRLGWVLHGNLKGSTNSTPAAVFHTCQCEPTDMNLHDLVKESFALDSLGVPDTAKLLSAEDRSAIAVMNNTAVNIGDRWEVGLLWKNDLPLVESRPAALKRLYCLERKMDKDADFAKQYSDKIVDYIEKGYARKLSHAEAATTNDKTWYLPHLAVFNPNKPGKVRVVFDCSARSNGMSLNDYLYKGPDMYSSIPKILMKFRLGKIGFGGDIKEMFLQIRIRADDQNAQRFLWRGAVRDRPPDTYLMQAMLFGAICSPYQAQEIRNRNALRFVDEFPEAVKDITECHYMDDYLGSANSVDEATRRIQEVGAIHKSGGFVMCNWVSNSLEVIQRLQGSLDTRAQEVIFDEKFTEKVLGLRWEPLHDIFLFNVNYRKIDPEVLTNKRRPTKREILRLVMSIFDPLGFLCYFTIRAKIILQQVWRCQVDWDAQIPESLEGSWATWLADLKEMETIRIPRCYTPRLPQALITDFHIFCDASDRAYSAVGYLRLDYGEGEVETRFVAAKSKVAPLKQISIPRLELQAALLGTKLAVSIRESLKFTSAKTYFWSDSGTVINWIRNHERRYKMYVAHRLGEILENSNSNDWRWAPGRENVADGGTKEGRGIYERWLTGPDFLKSPEEAWPRENPRDSDDDCEVMGVTASYTASRRSFYPIAELLDETKFSSWLRLLRTTVWLVRAVNMFIVRPEVPLFCLSICPDEIVIAEQFWWRRVQNAFFGEEISLIKARQPIPPKSSLFRLNPVLDSEGVLRVQGRIEAALGVEDGIKQPVILPSKTHFVRLMIDYFHKKAAHQGQEMVVNELRQRFWIIGVRRAVRSAWARCSYCADRRARPLQQSIGQLPQARLRQKERPFTCTGVDYFGPLWVKVRRSKVKRYGVLFTCMTTRAVHIEIASDLTADSTIMAIRRMCSRRGTPQEIWSDNGTNFRGAEKEIRQCLLKLNEVEVGEKLSVLGIKWNFIPPFAPHMGGCWERMVRSFKAALRATLKDHAPKEDVLHTVLTEIEHLLNSRPLTHVSMDATEGEALTPNHFLIGTSSGSSLWTSSGQTNLRQRWKESQHLTQQLWNRWLREYLPSLVRSGRCFGKASPAVAVGQLVYLPHRKVAGRWSRGRVEAVYPGRDGKVRVVDVKTEDGTVQRRAISSLLPLTAEQHLPGSEDVTADVNFGRYEDI